MTWLTILKGVLVALATFITTCLPAIIALVNSIKKYKAAKAEAAEAQKTANEAEMQAEAEAAFNDMLVKVNEFIKSAEITYKEFDAILKGQGASAGAMKKKTVMTDLQAYAIQNGYDFDENVWSAKIDEIVKLTKSVNVK